MRIQIDDDAMGALDLLKKYFISKARDLLEGGKKSLFLCPLRASGRPEGSHFTDHDPGITWHYADRNARGDLPT